MADRPAPPSRHGISSALDPDLLAAAIDCVDVVWAQDRDRRITYISPAVIALTGRSAEEHIGRRLHELPWVELMPGAIDQARAEFASHQPYRDRRLTVSHRDGSRRLVAVSGRPVFDADGAFQGYRGIAIEISGAVRAETIFQQIATTVSNRVGAAYLQTLVRAVAEALAVDLAFIGRIVGERRDHIRTAATFEDGRLTDEVEYALKDTPCHDVAAGEICLYSSGTAARFPADPGLVRRGIEGYCGLPMIDVQGQPIGLLVVLSRTPFKEPELVSTVLQLFTGRATLELERQSAEAQLRRSEELLTESHRLGKLGYMINDIVNDRVRWSDTLFELRRVPPRPFFTLAETLLFVHPDDRARALAAREAAVAERRTYEIDLRILHGDGSVAWEHLIGHPQYDERGTCTGLLLLLQDVTDRQLASEALKRREADLQAIMDNAPLMIFLKNRDGRYRLANRTYSDWLGYEPGGLQGRTTSDVLPHPLADQLLVDDRAVLERGAIIMREFQTAELGREADGPAHLLFTKFPTRDERGVITGIAGFAYDITTRKLAEDALRRSEERFRALIEEASDIVLVAQPDGTITYRSPASARVFQYGTGEIIGRSLFDRIHPEDQQAFADAFREVAAGKGGVATGRTRIYRKDGVWRHVAWSARNAIDVPAIGGVIIYSRDVTEALTLEEQLRQAQKMEAVGQLAGGIAHDFNNIIGAILGFANFLTDDLPADSPDHGYAMRIVDAGHRAKDLVQHILAFSRQSGVERQLEDIAVLARAAEGLLRAALPSSARLEFDISQDALVAEVNPVQIDQVLLNLCVNASDALAGEPGTVRVAVAHVAPGDADRAIGSDRVAAPSSDRSEPINRVTAGAVDPQTGYARITVSDSGNGMSAEIVSRAFDPFFTTKERGRGTGLGLSIVHGVVTGYGGACHLESALGRGTAVSVYIPLSAGQPARPGARPRATDIRGRERILIVDDEADMAEFLATGLERLGYSATAINDPVDALAAFERTPDAWDLVISDQVMPGIKGMTLFTRFKAIKPSLRFILCTGFSDAASETRALAQGIDAFFLKPVTLQQVAAAIRDIIART